MVLILYIYQAVKQTVAFLICSVDHLPSNKRFFSKHYTIMWLKTFGHNLTVLSVTSNAHLPCSSD